MSPFRAAVDSGHKDIIFWLLAQGIPREDIISSSMSFTNEIYVLQSCLSLMIYIYI